MVILEMNTQFFHLLDTHSLILTRTMMEIASLSMLRWRLQREYPIPCRMVALMCVTLSTSRSVPASALPPIPKMGVVTAMSVLLKWISGSGATLIQAARMCPDALASKS